MKTPRNSVMVGKVIVGQDLSCYAVDRDECGNPTLIRMDPYSDRTEKAIRSLAKRHIRLMLRRGRARLLGGK